MADVVVGVVLDKLKMQLLEQSDLIGVMKEEVDGLSQDLRNLKAFLKEADRTRSSNEILKHFLKELKTIVYKAEDLTDKFMIEARLHNKKGIFRFFDLRYFVKARRWCKEIRSIREKLKDIQKHRVYGLSLSLPFEESKQTRNKLRRAPVIEEDEVVGFDEEAAKIIKRLLVGSAHLEIIPIVGMPGIGKTTLANKIFKNVDVAYEFYNRIWVYVSQSYIRRDVYLNIISHFTRNTEQYRYDTDEALAEVIRERLSPGKYLIVLDDVWTSEALNDVKIALPNNMKGSRVLLTTRDSSLAKFCCNEPHQLKFLTPDECWELLQKKVFHKDKCPPDLEEIGKRIAMKCMGLPLAALVIAGALTGRGKTRSEWERVHQGVSERIISSDRMTTNYLVQMSYDSLPVDLRACFLYCGAFPRGSEIPACKIVRLWVAEGFIPYTTQTPLETVAEEYLNELVSKSLLMVTRRTSNGQIKTFRLHDLLHEFCTLEASEENLFNKVKLGIEQYFPRNQEIATFRRLSIDSSSVKEFISSKPYAEGIRSLLCFSSRENKMSPYELETIPKSFPLLRVLDVESISFPGFHKQFFQLYHLRYIAISNDSLKILPKFMEVLWNLQTLRIVTQQETLDIQADVCNMPHFRHLHTNASAKLHPSAVKPNNRGVLQTLSLIEPESCTKHVLERCQNLKKLGIRGNVKELASLFGLKYLEKLKLVNLAGGELRLPSENLCPRSLKKLTLSGTRFDWNEMGRVLGHLEFLEVLKLKENAFSGRYWESKDYAFPSLKVLWIESSDLVSWELSEQNFPSLEKLVLWNLHDLEEVSKLADIRNLQIVDLKGVPKLADIGNLQMVELDDTTKSSVESAREIKSRHVFTDIQLASLIAK